MLYTINIKNKYKIYMKLKLFIFTIFFLFVSCEQKDPKPNRNYNLYSMFKDNIQKKDLCSYNTNIAPMKVELKGAKSFEVERKKLEFSACDALHYLEVLKNAKISHKDLKVHPTGGLQNSHKLGSAKLYSTKEVYKNNSIFALNEIFAEASIELTFVFNKNLDNINKSQIQVYLNSSLEEIQTGPSFNLYPDKIGFKVSQLAPETDFACYDPKIKKYSGSCVISRESIHTVCLEVYPKHNLYMGWLNPCSIVKKDTPDFKREIKNAKFEGSGLAIEFREAILKSFVINQRGIYTGKKSK